MRKMGCILLIIALLLCSVISCSNPQRSSQEEALFIIQNLPDFQENLQYFSVSSGAAIAMGFSEIPRIYQSLPKLEQLPFVHVVIYRTKQNTIKLILLNDERPPKIVLVKEFNCESRAEN